MSRKSTPSVGGASEHVGTSHIPSNATPSAEKSAGLYDKWKKVCLISCPYSIDSFYHHLSRQKLI